MNSQGWIPIVTIASFNRIKGLTGGAGPEYAASLLKDVVQLSSLVEVNSESDEVRLKDGRWIDFLLPEPNIRHVGREGSSGGETGGHVGAEFEGEAEGEDTEDEDIEFVLGKDGSPMKRSWTIPYGYSELGALQ